MLVIYSGPHHSGVEVGPDAIFVKRGKPTELPDDLAKALIGENPDDWSEAPTPDVKASKKQEN